MRKRKEEKSNEISTPVLLELPSSEFSEQIINEDINNKTEEGSVDKETDKKDVVIQENISQVNYITGDSNYFSNSIQERNNKMINSVNPNNQIVQPLANVIFTGNNVRTKSCEGCCGWLSHNNNSGIFTLTKPGIYKVHFNANVAPTVAGAITLNITNAGENIAGGEMKTAGTVVGTLENISAEVLVRVPCNSSVVVTVKNNTPTNQITVTQPSLVITREC